MKERSFDEMVAYFNHRVSEMDIDQDYKMELLGMVTALGYKHEKTAQPDLDTRLYTDGFTDGYKQAQMDAQEIIRCKDCRWWDKYGNYDNGYCMAAKHGYLSEHWEINIRRTYKGDFYCADAERKTDEP